jgi:hypothetical protein
MNYAVIIGGFKNLKPNKGTSGLRGSAVARSGVEEYCSNIVVKAAST